MPSYSNRIVVLSLCCVLSACAVGPDYERPETALSKKGGAHSYIHKKKILSKPKSMAKWWTRLNDPVMDRYVKQLLSHNLSLKESAERVIQARETLNVTQGSYFPSLAVGGAAQRGFTSQTVTGQRLYSTSLGSDLTIAWQADVFGKIRRSAESGYAKFKASKYDKEALEHSLIAELLKRRVAVAILMRREQLAQQNVGNQKKIYDLVKRRYDLGVKGASSTDVSLAEETYRSTQASLLGYQRQKTEELYKLDVLLGQVPGSTKPTMESMPLLSPPHDVAVCLPASLLDRRPDLRASELRLMAANAEIGVAIADLFPSISLGSALSFAGDGAGSFFTSSNMAGSLFTNLSMRLFEGGALRANIRLKESKTRELMATYGRNVLEAVREVETALMSEQKLGNELKYKKQSVNALKRAEAFSEARYLKGITTLRNTLDVQQKRAQSEQDWLSTQQSKWNSRISLYLALGGDWMGDDVKKLNKMVCTRPSVREK